MLAVTLYSLYVPLVSFAPLVTVDLAESSLLHLLPGPPSPLPTSSRPCDASLVLWLPVTVHPPSPGCLPSDLF